jgi:UDP-3-O-[3-hydroxymyristoyl] glucosamine N-acyltransferase
MGLALGELSQRIGGQLQGDPERMITTVATLQDAVAGEISFLANPRYRRYLQGTRASAVILSAEHAGDCPTATITVANPYAAYARAATLLFPAAGARQGVHASAVIGNNCSVDATAWIGPHCIIEDDVTIAAGVQLQGGCFVGKGSRIGNATMLGPQVTVCHAVDIGARGLIHPGVVIGSDGFGLANDDGRWIKVPQLGRVCIGSDVEIGANSTIDRGALGDTIIEDGVKLDNQVHVAHNVRIGKHTVVAGCTGISGSADIGCHCRIGGGVGILGHLEIADHVTVTAMSLVTKSLPGPGRYSSGMPAQEHTAWKRNVGSFRDIGELLKKLRRSGKHADKTE